MRRELRKCHASERLDGNATGAGMCNGVCECGDDPHGEFAISRFVTIESPAARDPYVVALGVETGRPERLVTPFEAEAGALHERCVVFGVPKSIAL